MHRAEWIALILLILSSSAPGATITSITTTCTATKIDTGNVVFQKTQNTATNCETPFGLIGFINTVLSSNLNLASGTQVEAFLQSVLAGAAEDGYLISSSVDLRLRSEEAYVITGGTGPGVIVGQFDGYSSIGGSLGVIRALEITTPFGNCAPCGNPDPVEYSFPFVFGKPFTILIEGRLSIADGPETFPDLGAAVSFRAGVPFLMDVNGNPIQGTINLVPEPGSFGLLMSAAGFFLIGLALRNRLPRSLH